MSGARIAVDIGGTFTDIALAGRFGLVTHKTLTTPSAPETGVMEGVTAALSIAGVGPGEIESFIHGTTLATNALIERKGARTAFLTTAGHRDVLEMAHENRFDQYALDIERPAPLVPRWLRLPVTERVAADGAVIEPLDEESVLVALEAAASEGAESIAIGFLHAYASDIHERCARDIVARMRPDLPITLSSEVAPAIREFERFSTAVANAYVRPLMEGYLRRLAARLDADGFQCQLLLMTSGGGLCSLETAARQPIRLVESGPAGGAILAAETARRARAREVLSFDMGGTTAKLCFIDDFSAAAAPSFEFDRAFKFKKGSGTPLLIPAIDMVEIGAGGGSMARVDAVGRIAVGPESAGANPGPAAYGRGGTSATVTDADVVLGRIDPARFASGAVAIDESLAAQALDQAVGAPLGLDAASAAHAVSEIVEENMAAAARAHAAECAVDLSGRVMTAFGGAAPLHAARLAEKLAIRSVIVPSGAGVGSAIGFLLAPAAFEIVRSLRMDIESFDASVILNLFARMREEAQSVVRSADARGALVEECAAFMRYRGQGFEVATPIGETLSAGALRAAFERRYAERFGRTIPGARIEALSWSLRLSGPAPTLPPLPEIPSPLVTTPAGTGKRMAFDAAIGAFIDHAVIERDALTPDLIIQGPALIVEAQTTTLVPSTFSARLGENRSIVLTLKDFAA